MSDLQWLLNVICNLARWPFIGDDGLTPWERRASARRFDRTHRLPTPAEREQLVIDAWRDLPASVCVSLMAEAPRFYFAVARWAAHKDAAVTFGAALSKAQPGD